MTAAPPTESEFLLLIADISGYTRFMMKNHTARVHAHGIISDLIAAVIAEVRIPLEVVIRRFKTGHASSTHRSIGSMRLVFPRGRKERVAGPGGASCGSRGWIDRVFRGHQNPPGLSTLRCPARL
jgi:hypothetical protein